MVTVLSSSLNQPLKSLGSTDGGLTQLFICVVYSEKARVLRYNNKNDICSNAIGEGVLILKIGPVSTSFLSRLFKFL